MKEMVANVLNDFKERKKNGCVRTIWVNTLPPREVFHASLLSAVFFFKINFFEKKSGIPPECQTDWIQIRPDILGPICLQRLSAEDTWIQ